MSTDPQTATNDSATKSPKSSEEIAQNWAIKVAPVSESGKSLAEMDEAETAAHVAQLYAKDGELFGCYKRNRAALAEALWFVKENKCERGRNGKWSSFLEKVGISRSSADQLVGDHKTVLSVSIAIKRAAEEAGVNLYERAVVSELAAITADLNNCEPAPEKIDGLIVRLGAARLSNGGKKSSSTALSFESFVSRIIAKHKLETKSSQERCAALESIVKMVAERLKDNFTVTITPIFIASEGKANTATTSIEQAA